MKPNEPHNLLAGTNGQRHRPDSGLASQPLSEKSRRISLVGVTQYESGAQFVVQTIYGRFFALAQTPSGLFCFHNPATGLPWSAERSCTRWTRKVLKKPGLINPKWAKKLS